VAKWARESSETAGIQASRSEQLARYWNRLPDFLGELQPTMAELERTADAQIPTLRRLGGAAPELARFLRTAQPFARETRSALEPLGEMADAGSSAIAESREEIQELRRLARLAPRLGKPLRQFLQTIDDRRRSTEREPAAAAVAPPAPDKTAYRDGRGFTGMEAFWNYVYFQTLGINAHDELGHLLRIVLFTGGPCAPYNANPTVSEIEDCNSWLGPSQPGITVPDPTATGVAARERAERRRSTPRERARPRRPGDPEAPPTPGKRDPSKPQVTLPSDLEELIEDLRDRVPPEVPPVLDDPQSSLESQEQLLDYLLGP
jgi:hypothetical protein